MQIDIWTPTDNFRYWFGTYKMTWFLNSSKAHHGMSNALVDSMLMMQVS